MHHLSVTLIALLLVLFPVSYLYAQTSENQLGEEYFRFVKQKNVDSANIVQRQILELYPHGPYARRIAIGRINGLNGNEYLEAAAQFRRDFPIAAWYEHPDSQGFSYVGFYTTYAKSLFNARLIDELEEVLPEMEYDMVCEVFRRGPVFLIMKTDDNPEDYYEIAQLMFRRMDETLHDYVSVRYADGLPHDKPEDVQFRERYHKWYTCIMAQILEGAGQHQEAVDMMGRITDSKERYSLYTEGNEAYARALLNLGRQADAVQAMKEAAALGKMTTALQQMLQEYYDSLPAPKPAPDFGAYLEQLRSDDYQAQLDQHMRSSLIDQGFEPFVVKTIDGQEVRSADWGPDDIVVLDFWATWCAPCVASFEGMQLAVNQYRDDPHVHFYFVCTEDEPSAETITRLFSRRHLHDMTVVMDNRAPGKKANTAVYKNVLPGVSGIPQKAVLLGNRVRYRSEGYKGSPTGLRDELSTIIEYLKKN